MNPLQLLNIATTRRNIALRRGDETLRLGWESRAIRLAETIGTRLVRMPDRPHAIVPEIFLQRWI